MAEVQRYLALIVVGGLALFAIVVPLAAADQTPGLFDRPVLAIDPGRHTGMIRQADVDEVGKVAVTGSEDKTVRLWSVADGKLLRTIRMPTGPDAVGKIFAVAMSPDGSTVAAGGWTRIRDEDQQEQVYLFDTHTGAMTNRLTGLPDVVHYLAFSPDGRRLAVMLYGANGLRLYPAVATEAGPNRRATRTISTPAMAPPSLLMDGWRRRALMGGCASTMPPGNWFARPKLATAGPMASLSVLTAPCSRSASLKTRMSDSSTGGHSRPSQVRTPAGSTMAAWGLWPGPRTVQRCSGLATITRTTLFQ
jgi:WD40 repeat protein